MRVLIAGLHYAPEPSGNAPYTTALARGLVRRGHHVCVVAGVPHYPEWRVPTEYRRWRTRGEDAGVDLIRLRHFVPRSPSLPTRVLMEMSFGAHLLTDRCVRSFRPDVVICVSPALLSSAMIVASERRRTGRPALGLWVQDIYSSGMRELHGSSRAGGALSRLEGITFRRVDGVAVAHDRFRAQVAGSFGVPEGKVDVIRNWTHLPSLPVSDIHDIRALLGWGSDHVVLHAGNMGLKQGLHTVVKAAALADERRSRVRFVLLGGGNQETGLREAAAGVQRIEFVRPLDQPQFQAALAAADVLLVNEAPGVSEMSVPSKLTSYFVSGRPVLAATAAGGVTANEIEASGAGRRVDSGNAQALLEGAESLAADAGLAAELGRRGQQFARERLSEEAALDHFETWIEALISRSPRASAPH